MPTTFDAHNIAHAIFLPLVLWSLAVILITLSGYPGVVCMTPVAWLLALSVGARVANQSESAGFKPILEAAIGGAVLGFWQGLLFAAVMAASPYLPGSSLSDDLPEPFLVGIVASCIGIPVTAALAALLAWIVTRKRLQQNQ